MARVVRRCEFTDSGWERPAPYFPERELGDKGRSGRDVRNLLEAIGMRRKDREVENPDEVYDILKRCDTVKIAMRGEVYPYIVPVSFGTERTNGKVVIYFHCAQEGAKVALLKANPHVCVEGEIFMRVEKTAHGITARYESVVGFGVCTFVTGREEIIHGMKLLTGHYGYDEYPLECCAGLDHLLVGKIVLDEIHGKKNLPGSLTPADRDGKTLR